MQFCSYCGKKINVNTKFCTYCGKNLSKKNKIKEQHETKKPSHLNLSIFLVVIFIGLVTLIVVFLNQRTISTKSDNIQLVLPEDKLLEIEQQIKEIKSLEERRKVSYINEKPFVKGNYGYDDRTRDFRFVCSKPCPVQKQILDQESAAISVALSTLRGITKSDINEKLLPFEVHASEDNICPDKGAPAYMSGFFVDSNGYQRGLLCFKFDKVEYDRSNFPYSTSVHEVNHLFQEGKFPEYTGNNRILTEGLSMILDSFFEKGNQKDSFCWQGNNWYSQIASRTDSVHIKGASLFFELCNQYGFDYNNLPELFRQLERKNGNVAVSDFISIVNNIVGDDTSHIFRNVGVI